MTILDFLLFIVGLAGVGFMIYAFSAIKLFKARERWLGISLLMLMLVLVSDRVFSPNDAWDFPGLLPAQQQDSTDQQFQTGWQNIPYVMFNFLLEEFGNFGDALPTPSSPQPSVIPPTPSPAPTSPKPWPSIALPPPLPVDPDPIPADPIPTDPTPTDPTPPLRPSPQPSASAPPIAPRSPKPVPAWW